MHEGDKGPCRALMLELGQAGNLASSEQDSTVLQKVEQTDQKKRRRLRRYHDECALLREPPRQLPRLDVEIKNSNRLSPQGVRTRNQDKLHHSQDTALLMPDRQTGAQRSQGFCAISQEAVTELSSLMERGQMRAIHVPCNTSHTAAAGPTMFTVFGQR